MGDYRKPPSNKQQSPDAPAPRWFVDGLMENLTAMRRYARKLTRNVDDADDMVSECVCRALTKWALFERGTNLTGWLLAMVHNAFVNRMRAVHRAPKMVDLFYAAELEQPSRQGAMMAWRDALSLVHQLEPRQRDVVMAMAYGVDYDSLATMMDVPVGTVRSRLSRGRDALRQDWNRQGEPPPKRRRRRVSGTA